MGKGLVSRKQALVYRHSLCAGRGRLRGAASGCAVHRFAMGRGTLSSVHEGGGDLGQEPGGTQMTSHFFWRPSYILIQVCSRCPFLLMNTISTSYLLQEAHRVSFPYSFFPVLVGASSVDSEPLNTGIMVKGLINISYWPALRLLI